MPDSGPAHADLLRDIYAGVRFLCEIVAARELFKKSYFELGPEQRQILEREILFKISEISNAFLSSSREPAGFRST